MILMTPEEARRLLYGTTPGPWELSSSRSIDGIDIVMYDGTEMERRNVALAAAAPTLAAMIARMREEWGVAVTYPGLAEVVEWGYSQAGALEEVELASTAPGAEYRVVRRYVTEPEEA